MSRGEKRGDKTFLNFTDNSKVTHIKKEDAIEYLTKIKKVDENIISEYITDFFEDKLRKMSVDKKFQIVALVEKIQINTINVIIYSDNLLLSDKKPKVMLTFKKQELESKDEYSSGDMVVIWKKGKKIKVKKIKQNDEDILLNYFDFLQKISKEDFKNWVVETRD